MEGDTMELSMFTKRCYQRRYCTEVLDDGYLHHHGPRTAMDGQVENLLETTGVLVGKPRAVHGNAMQYLAKPLQLLTNSSD